MINGKSKKSHTAMISVGSNMGDKIKNCRQGILAVTRSGESEITGQSKFYKTEPVDYKEQDWFVNAAVRIETRLDPFELLSLLQMIQKQAGREKDTIKFGPRIIDLDIILYDDRVIESDQLIVPHPRMHKRRFVLQPICDIDPKIIHPVLQKDMRYLLDHVHDEGQGIVPY